MTVKEFKNLVIEEDFYTAVEMLAEEENYIKRNGYEGDFYRTDWHDVYGYPIEEGDKITCFDDIIDFLEED